MKYLLYSILLLSGSFSAADELRFLCETSHHQEFQLSKKEQLLPLPKDSRFILTVEGDRVEQTEWGGNTPLVFEECLVIRDTDYRCSTHDLGVLLHFDTSKRRFLQSSTRGYYHEILADINPWMTAGECTKF